MSEMIERVAMALYDANSGHDMCDYEDLARAAIAAMWDPTEAMCREFSADDRAVWQAMIDAALQEPTP